MNYGIAYTPTQEYITFINKDGKTVLFDKDKQFVIDSIIDIMMSDGGIDDIDKTKDIVLIAVNTDTDGSEFITDDDEFFVDKQKVKI